MDYRLAFFTVAYVATSLLASRHGARVLVAGDGSPTFNVLSYGALGDGKRDDTRAFSKAWVDVCNANGDTPTLIVPQGMTFLLKSINFQGACKSTSIRVEIQGNIVAPNSIQEWGDCINNGWLIFSHVDNLIVEGQGEIDGRGSIWWKNVPISNRDDHAIHEEAPSSCNSPRALTFQSCNGLQLRGLTHKNSPKSHISIEGCNNSTISNTKIVAPEDSPNTDGIDVSSTNYLNILHSIIGTGDDCIAIGSDTSQIYIENITCGPGHGISVGSLGENGAQAKVEEIHVKNCTFISTSNGARIKTWQGGSGYAKNITYEGIILKDAQNPIIIDQFYCFGNDCKSKTLPKAVAVSDVQFNGFQGTSSSVAAITLNCSQAVPCNNIILDTIDITSTDPSKNSTSTCENAHVQQSSVLPLVHCT